MKRQELAAVPACVRQKGPCVRFNSTGETTKRIPRWDHKRIQEGPQDHKQHRATGGFSKVGPVRGKNGSDQGPLRGWETLSVGVGERTREISAIGKESHANQSSVDWDVPVAKRKGRSIYEMLGSSGPSIAYWYSSAVTGPVCLVKSWLQCNPILWILSLAAKKKDQGQSKPPVVQNRAEPEQS